MSFYEHETKNHHYHHNPRHAKHHHSIWDDSSDSFQNSGRDYCAIERPLVKKHQAAEEHERKQVHVKLADQDIYSDNVDAATEEFIKLEHKVFAYSKTMPMNGA